MHYDFLELMLLSQKQIVKKEQETEEMLKEMFKKGHDSAVFEREEEVGKLACFKINLFNRYFESPRLIVILSKYSAATMTTITMTTVMISKTTTTRMKRKKMMTTRRKIMTRVMFPVNV